APDDHPGGPRRRLPRRDPDPRAPAELGGGDPHRPAGRGAGAPRPRRRHLRRAPAAPVRGRRRVPAELGRVAAGDGGPRAIRAARPPRHRGRRRGLRARADPLRWHPRRRAHRRGLGARDLLPPPEPRGVGGRASARLDAPARRL
ncbi:MAG: hypothetical protein AVDCRST_MAG11-3208, partial [uncultured Gemmatimonadaceae bacterium]